MWALWGPWGLRILRCLRLLCGPGRGLQVHPPPPPPPPRGMSIGPARGIVVYDQWVTHPVAMRTLYFKGGVGLDYSNDGDLFFTIK